MNVGIMPFIYGGLRRKLMDSLSDEYHNLPDILKHKRNDTREKAYVFHTLISNLYKHKTINNYKSQHTKNKICTKFNISDRSYYRYIQNMIQCGMATFDKDNKTLRLISLNRLCIKVLEEYNTYYCENGIDSVLKLNNNDMASATAENFDFKYVQYVLRYIYIKYAEHLEKRKISMNIKRSMNREFSMSKKKKLPKNGDYFVLTENNYSVQNKYVGNKKSSEFNSVYRYVFNRIRGSNPQNLYHHLFKNKNNSVIRLGVRLINIEDRQTNIIEERLKNNKNIAIDNKNILEVQNRSILGEISSLHSNINRKKNFKKNAESIRKMGNMISENQYYDDKTDDMISKNHCVLDKNISLLIKNYNVPRLSINNSIDVSHSCCDPIYIKIKDIEYLNNLLVMSPKQYYKLMSCDFGLEYRYGFKKISELFDLSKSQISKMIKEMSHQRITKLVKRYVYICSVTSQNPTLLIKSLKSQFSLIYDNEFVRYGYSFDRMVYMHGNILYEIESEKIDNINIEFHKDILYKLHGNKMIIQSRYKRLCKKIYKN